MAGRRCWHACLRTGSGRRGEAAGAAWRCGQEVGRVNAELVGSVGGGHGQGLVGVLCPCTCLAHNSCPPGVQVMGRVRQRNTPMVIDADGLWLVNQQPDLVQGEGAQAAEGRRLLLLGSKARGGAGAVLKLQGASSIDELQRHYRTGLEQGHSPTRHGAQLEDLAPLEGISVVGIGCCGARQGVYTCA